MDNCVIHGAGELDVISMNLVADVRAAGRPSGKPRARGQLYVRPEIIPTRSATGDETASTAPSRVQAYE